MRRNLFRAAVLALVLGSAAVAASAQVTGLFYKEEAKDGRIYVFNTPEVHKRWAEGGDIGVSITLVGRGENGETLIAENETAADLYFFRHNLDGYDRPTPKPATPAFTVGWKDGKTSIESKSAKLDISNRVQIRFTNEMPEVGDDRGSFRIRRAKTKFEGWAYTKDLTYELQLNWADTTNSLEDAVVNYDFTKGAKTFQLKTGQFKVPFGRQELTSSGSQQFVDRSLASGEFARGRDIGVQVWGQPAAGKFDWRLGIFNGNGRNVTRNDNDKYQINARATWQPFGDVKYSEGDFESSAKPLFALSGQYESNDRSGATAGDDLDREIVGGDVVFKYKGFSAYAELFQASNDREIAADFDSEGLIAQVGYFVIPKRLELAVRLSEIDPDTDRDDNERTETGFAIGYFFNKHPHKLQADFREIENKATNITDKEIRLQYQIIF